MSKHTVIILPALCLFIVLIQASSFAQGTNIIPIRTASDEQDSSTISIRTSTEPVPDTEQSQCIRCHEDSYDRALSNPYQHSILRSTCKVCHIKRVTAEDLKRELFFNVHEEESIFSLGRLEEGAQYSINLIATDGEGRRNEPLLLTVQTEDVPSMTYPALQKTGNIQVVEISKGAFVKASIYWETDTYASSEVEYTATGNYPESYSMEDVFVKKHFLTIPNLGHNKTYRLRAISTDMHGNRISSDEFTLNTSREIPLTKEDGVISGPPVLIKPVLHRTETGEDFYLSVTVNKSSNMLIIINKIRNTVEDKHGEGLVSERYLSIDSCYECHARNTSHPVNVKIRGDRINIPDDLPTIEKGVITCLTCHLAHGGARRYYTRFDSGREICIKCHDSGYDRKS